jgi:glycosyltransferase involved in cell wall biosynthesis
MKTIRTVLDIRTATDHFPGIGRYAYQLAHSLSRQRDRGELALLCNAGASKARFDIFALAAQSGIQVVSVDAPPFSAKEQLRIPSVLRKLAPGLVHFPYTVFPYAAPKPVIFSLHDLIPLRLPQFFSRRQRILYRASLSLALLRADFVICSSESTRSDLQALLHADPSRLFVVPLGVDEAFHDSSAKASQKTRKAYNLPDDYVLYVGSNKPHKNLPILVEAYAQVRSAPVLVIAGAIDGRFSQERRNAERLGLGEQVRFLGALQEEVLPSLYCGARAFVFPSLCEGFGLPVLEAMTCGVPVACSDIPSLRETAANAALFFDPNDCRSIALALDRILGDIQLREELRVGGIKRSAELSWDVVAQKTLAVYNAVVSSR